MWIYHVTMTKHSSVPLTPAVFYILLSLHMKERHGYEIMKQVRLDSSNHVVMGPGTLYGSVKRMLTKGLIEETSSRLDPHYDDMRRKYYKITDLGEKLLSSEIARYKKAVVVYGRASVVSKLAVDYGLEAKD